MLLRGYNSTPFQKGKIKNATRKNPCKVCGGTGCGIINNGAVVLCWRESYGAVKQTESGSWLHILKDDFVSSYIPPKKPKVIIPPTVGTVYEEFLNRLVLKNGHYDHLSKIRKLSDKTIKDNQFRSVPTATEARMLCTKLSRDLNLKHIPGFYFDGEWRLNIKGSGFFVPYRDIKGTIQGMQVRFDYGKTRYLWLTSGKYETGASPGAPIHYSQPDLVRDKIWITEGGLKAICITEYERIPVIALGGVTAMNYENLFNRVRIDLPAVTNIAICFDIDWKKNVQVQHALVKMTEEAQNQGFNTTILDWDAKLGKGYDDYLLTTRINY